MMPHIAIQNEESNFIFKFTLQLGVGHVKSNPCSPGPQRPNNAEIGAFFVRNGSSSKGNVPAWLRKRRIEVDFKEEDGIKLAFLTG